jgi:hypothetical protein
MSNKPNLLIFHVDNISQGDFGCDGGAFSGGWLGKLSAFCGVAQRYPTRCYSSQ